MRRAELNLGVILNPRSLVISSPTHALLLRTYQREHSKELLVEFVEINNQTELGIKLAPCWGCLGLLEIEREIFIVIVTHASSIGILHPSHHQICRVGSVDLFCLTSAAFDYRHVFYHSSNLNLSSSNTHEFEEFALDPPALNGIKKIISNGQFYFSTTPTDLSSRTQSRFTHQDRTEDNDSARFSWNSFMLDGLMGFQNGLPYEAQIEFDRQNFLVSVIQGFVAAYELKLPPPTPTINDPLIPDQSSSHQPITISISLFSRLGSRRAGTRFNTRGIDDDGNVANFVETETVIVSGSNLFSFVQIRGSVPLFFEQSGTGMTNVIGGLSGQGHRTNLTRTGMAAQPAFERHFEDLLSQYSSVYILNLLSQSRDSEQSLSQAYHARLKAFQTDDVQMVNFDLHHRAKVAGLEGVRLQLMNDPMIGGKIDQMGYFLASLDSAPDLEPDAQAAIITRQTGVFRVNCLDCLDRTNVIQEMLSRMAVESFLSSLHPHLIRSEYLWNCHRTLWADNGDVLSKIYAGTGALNTSFTRGGKQTISGMLSNASKSVGRMYNSNFIDKSKQAYIDLMLGNLSGQKPVKVFDPLNETIKRMLHERRADYSQIGPTSIWVGTYNLNGRAPPIAANNDELLSWLSPVSNLQPDLMAISFQEIVKLSPQQIMVSDPEKRKRWERVILSTLENRANKTCSYVIIRSAQLVGTALIILVKSELIGAVRSVEAKTKKTGLKGIAGNKGAVAIRLELYDTSFCFVTAHFAAGLTNVDERNHNYETISEGLKFSKGQTITGHENIIWAGDFNYRIDGGLSNLLVRQAVADENFTELLAADQLIEHMSNQAVFPKYLEGPITFAPTYKYDVGCDRYDTSEKMRIPAWTDRILYLGNDFNLTHYSRAELKSSDHRPVYAILQAQVRMVDRVKKEAIRQEILESSEVENLRDSLLMPLQAAGDASSITETTALDEWWKTPQHPDGSCEIASLNQVQVTGGQSSNPFHLNLTVTNDQPLQSPHSEANLSVGHSSNRRLVDRQISFSVPSSPLADALGTRNQPPAIPARPTSRSPSQPPGKSQTDLSLLPSVRKQRPPPPPRPISKCSPSPEKTLTLPTEVDSKRPSSPVPNTSSSGESLVKGNHLTTHRSRSLSARKSAPSGLQLVNLPLPPPAHPSKLSGSVRSPLLSASTSGLLPHKQYSTMIKKTISADSETTHNPPLPPRPISKLLNREESTAVGADLRKSYSLCTSTETKQFRSSRNGLEPLNHPPPIRSGSRVRSTSKEPSEMSDEGASIGFRAPSRPTSQLVRNQSENGGREDSDGLLVPSRKSSNPSLRTKPRPSLDHLPPRPTIKPSAGPKELASAAPAPGPTDHPPARPGPSAASPPPPIPPKPSSTSTVKPGSATSSVSLTPSGSAALKPPRPPLKPKPVIVKRSASHEFSSLHKAPS